MTTNADSNSFAALDESVDNITTALAAIDTAAIQVTEEKSVKVRERRNGKAFAINEFETKPEVKFSGLVNNTEHYLKLAQEAINCLCNRAQHTIQHRLEKLLSGTTSMNIVGPVFKDEFYVRLNDTRWAFIKESVLKEGKVDIDGVEYVLNLQNAIRIWDVICGPNDRPTLFRDKKIESLGEKLQRLIQEDTRKDLIKEGKLQETDEYKPSVWLFLAYRRTFRNRQDPCRFISMCWDSDGTTPDRLMSVSNYCSRADHRTKYDNQKPKYDNTQKPKYDNQKPKYDNTQKPKYDNRRPKYQPRPAQKNQTTTLTQPTQTGQL